MHKFTKNAIYTNFFVSFTENELPTFSVKALRGLRLKMVKFRI